MLCSSTRAVGAAVVAKRTLWLMSNWSLEASVKTVLASYPFKGYMLLEDKLEDILIETKQKKALSFSDNRIFRRASRHLGSSSVVSRALGPSRKPLVYSRFSLQVPSFIV